METPHAIAQWKLSLKLSETSLSLEETSANLVEISTSSMETSTCSSETIYIYDYLSLALQSKRTFLCPSLYMIDPSLSFSIHRSISFWHYLSLSIFIVDYLSLSISISRSISLFLSLSLSNFI